MHITRRFKNKEEFMVVVHVLREMGKLVDLTLETKTIMCQNCPEVRRIIEQHAPSGTAEPFSI